MRMVPGSFQWCLVMRKDSMGANWSRGGSSWTPGIPLVLCEGGWVLAEAVGFPSCRSSEAAWTWSWAACSGWPFLSRGLDEVASSGPCQPQPFCVILWKLSYAKKENVLSTPRPPSVTQVQHGASTSQPCLKFNENLRLRITPVAAAGSSQGGGGIVTFNPYFLFNHWFCSNLSKGYFKTA